MPSSRVLMPCAFMAILAIAPSPAPGAVLLSPGDHHVFGAADGGTTRIGRTDALAQFLGEGLNGLASGDADYDLANRRVRAQIIHVLGIGGNFEARSTIHHDFTVADSAGLERSIGAWVGYDARWKGIVWNGISLIANASVELELVLTDRTEVRHLNRVVPHERDAATFKVKFVKVGNPLSAQESGSAVGTLPAILTRGHDYRLTFLLTCRIFTPETSSPVAILSDYMAGLLDQGDGGASLARLEVKLGADDVEVRERLEKLEGHKHHYLTGRGEGHNNTQAVTGPVILGEPATGAIRDVDARREAEDAVIRWSVTNPFQLEGFHVYRAVAKEGPFDRLNRDPIPMDVPMVYRDHPPRSGAPIWYRIGAVGWTQEHYSAPVQLLDGAAASSLSLDAPNPLTTLGQIAFTLPHATEVDLRLFDVNGRVVRDLARGTFDAGAHVLRWEAGDPRGAAPPAGVYFLRLEAGGASLLRKLTVLH